MAVTKIWPVRDSLQRVLDYAANPQKTALAGDGLARALHYAGNDAKTRLAAADMDGEQVLLVSGIHCRAGQAWADMRAVQRNGRVFLPLAGVCSFFGLNYTYTPTQYGTLIRITNGQEWLSTQDFVSTASGDAMRTRYYEYLRQLEGDSQETSTPQTPGESTGGETEQEGLPVYLAVQCIGAGGLESILDSLDDRGARALFLFRGEALADSADQLRRLVGTGHAVGLSVSGASLETARAELEEGTALLEELAHLRPHTVYLEDAAAGVADALEAEGWVCWTANVDARDDGRSASTQATALLQNLEGRRSTARVLLDDSTACASMLERALPRMSRSDYQFRLALETRI